MITVPRGAEGLMLSAAVSLARRVHLFGNDHYPSRADELAAYVEISGGGYEPFELAADDWRVRADGALAVATYRGASWKFSGGVGKIYGYYVTSASGSLLWAERFVPGPFVAANPGDFVSVSLEFDLGQRGA